MLWIKQLFQVPYLFIDSAKAAAEIPWLNEIQYSDSL